MKKVSMVLAAFLLLACSTKNEDQDPLVCVYEPSPITVVSFSGVGDNLIHETVYLDALTSDGSYDFTKMYEDVADDMRKSDIAFINQETILGGSELGLSGYPSFNSPSEIASDLKESGFNLVNLATNHTLDRGLSGIVNELNTFSSVKGMVVDGAYTSQEAYDTIPTFEVKGITFSFLAYTYGTNGIRPEYSYEVSYFDDAQITSDVQRAKEISDVVIVSAHWGDENSFVPNSFQRHYAQLFADLGVDVVIGTHPHVIQPVEWVSGEMGNRTLVVYSLGNFIGGMLTTNNAIGGMIQFDFVKEEDDIYIDHVRWVPLMIHFEGNAANINAERYNYKSYKVSDYTDELASKHVLNGYDGNVVSLDYIHEITDRVIDASFLE
ncbi:CapA family protein [uncultured Traorella sp.]|uniref:CapA family protein n=1 Tax=uncultured Traorella sp. TaxID=1929048 RepID=UPI0025CEFD7C|nr:CapA family protein [uncultured Traorella sp.]